MWVFHSQALLAACPVEDTPVAGAQGGGSWKLVLPFLGVSPLARDA